MFVFMPPPELDMDKLACSAPESRFLCSNRRVKRPVKGVGKRFDYKADIGKRLWSRSPCGRVRPDARNADMAQASANTAK